METESGIEITKSKQGRPSKYPIRTMQPGESFFVLGQKIGGGAYSSAMSHAKTTGKVFKGRTTVLGVRIWRVE